LARTKEQQNIWAQQQCYIALGISGINQALDLNDKGLSAAILCPVGFRSQDDYSFYHSKSRLTQEQLVVTL